MKLTLPRTALAASFVFSAPFLAASAFAQENTEAAASATAETQTETQSQPSDAPAVIEIPAVTPAAPAEPAAAEEAQEEERICRRIRVDMSSRRKTRICLTEQGWRDLNNQR